MIYPLCVLEDYPGFRLKEESESHEGARNHIPGHADRFERFLDGRTE